MLAIIVAAILTTGCGTVSLLGLRIIAYGSPRPLEVATTIFCSIWSVIFLIALFYEIWNKVKDGKRN